MKKIKHQFLYFLYHNSFHEFQYNKKLQQFHCFMKYFAIVCYHDHYVVTSFMANLMFSQKLKPIWSVANDGLSKKRWSH